MHHAVATGAIGGAVTFAGKQLTPTKLKFLARSVSGLGQSLVAQPSLLRSHQFAAWLPVGPVRFRLTVGGHGLGARLDMASSATLLYYLVGRFGDFEVDWGASLRTGTMVLVGTRSGVVQAQGLERAGVILMLPNIAESRREEILVHELVHVLQHDSGNLSWGFRAEQGLLSAVWQEHPFSGLDVGLLAHGVEWWVGGDRFRRLRETEAEFFEMRVGHEPRQ